MPLKQLHVVEKIKFLVANSMRTKKQAVKEVENDAKEHLILNQRQEREDDVRINHARKELSDEENKIENRAHSRTFNMLVLNIFINFILLVAFILLWYFFLYKQR